MTVKITEDMKFSPSFEYIDNGIEHGVLSPFETKEVILKKGETIADGFKPLSVDIKMLKDVPVKLRDGVTIYTDIYMPVNADKVPTLIAWSPYGKSAGTAPRYKNLFTMLGMGIKWESGLPKFEGPDPDYWVAHGYAIANPDMRGIAHSEGNTTMIGTQEGEDGYDLIEWIAQQDWSNGKTALTGTSYLAFSQWFIAAQQPPHLTAMSPTEGLSDAYRDIAFIGGIPDKNFLDRLDVNHVSAIEGTKREDLTLEMDSDPLIDAPIWQDKIAQPEKIKVPAFVIASYANTSHTMGTFQAWRGLGSDEKWLRIHDSQEWPYYYDKDNTEELRRFFDHYLLDRDNGWEDTPQVRYTEIDFEGNNQLDIPAESFPPAGSELTKYYMNGITRTLQPAPEAVEIPVKYSVDLPGRASFQMTFDKDTTFVGYPKVKLFMEAEGYDDMDVFVQVQKLDDRGNILSEFIVPNHGAALQDFTQDGASALRYKGAWGRLRASMHHLDNDTTDEIPTYSFDRVEKLSDGEVVEMDIVLSPIGLSYKAGQTLRVVVGAKNELGSVMPGTPGAESDNKGFHIIHTGGEHASYIQLPLMK